ncbi:MAG: RsmD family RNA methyltransferase, partial [Opitutaceae bacterium]|nr:RsmD family RNA methyltransferase [Opitutaceae bacterium]
MPASGSAGRKPAGGGGIECGGRSCRNFASRIRACRRHARRSMRISGGTARGITLLTPKGDSTRPATDGMRQAVFSCLAARVPGARFVDLF